MRLDAAERLIDLRTGDGRPLPPCLVAEIRRELRRLKLVEEMIGEVETERDSVMAGTVADQRIALLRQVKGIGPVAATVLGREVFHREFTNRRELASYLGLTPSPWASAARPGHQQGGQRPSAHDPDRDRVAVDPLPARQPSGVLVPGARRSDQGAAAPDPGRRACP